MMKKRFWMKRNIACLSIVALTLVLGFTLIASADNGARNDFNAQYPGNHFGGSCNICHSSVPATNPYGAALRAAGGSANSILPGQFVAVEELDSDGDHFTNGAEIAAGTFPGDPTDFPAVPATITSIEPIQGGTLGTELTIIGSGLGSKKGKIVLTNVLGSDFGSATLKVANDGWAPGLITATLTKTLPPGDYDVTVYVQPYKTTSPASGPDPFTINEPVWLAFDDGNSGPPGTEIAITGSFFGTKKGKVSIEGQSKGKAKIANCKVTFWAMDTSTGESHLSFLIPKGLDPGTYPVTITNKVGLFADPTFTITIE